MYKWVVLWLLSTLAFAAGAEFSGDIERRHAQLREDAQSDNQPKGWLCQKTMTGDWLGLRPHLTAEGLTVSGAYVADPLGNPIGGRDQGFTWAGSGAWDAMLDLETRYGWCGWALYGSMLWRTGTSLSSEYIDNVLCVQQIFGGETVRLLQLYIRNYFCNKRGKIKIGRLGQGVDFITSPLYWQYVSGTFNGNPVVLDMVFPFSFHSKTTWGAYIHYHITPEWLVRLGGYNANEEIFENRFHGLNFTLKNTEGWTLAGECVYTPCFTRGPGHYKVGGYWLTGEKEKCSGGSEHNYGIYVAFDQTLFRNTCLKNDLGFTPWILFLWMPGAIDEFNFFSMGGLVYQAPLPGRPKDIFALGYGYTTYSKEFRTLQRQRGLPPPTGELLFEATYTIQITPWFSFQPDLQYIIRPSGLSSIPNSVVIGFQTQLDF